MKSEMSKRWLERVTYDLDTAKAMFETKRYIYTIFMCQQSIEKCLKALLVVQGKEVLQVHNLRRLAEHAEIIAELHEEALIKLDFLSSYYINARYKEDLKELSKGITGEVAKNFIRFAEETIQWLSQKMK